MIPSKRIIYLVIMITIADKFIAQIALMLFCGISLLHFVILIIKLALCIYGNLWALAAIHYRTENLGWLILITS